MMVKPKKSYGQHFLANRGVVEKIVAAISCSKKSVIVEIGPGLGALTQELAKRFGEDRLILVEADRDFIPELTKKFSKATILAGDAAGVDWKKVIGSVPWVLVGNLPYNAASAIMMQALESTHPPKEMVVMVQKEQADRMMAKPGKTGILSLAIQLQANPERLFNVAPGSFVPPPKVQSSVLRLTPIPHSQKETQKILHLASLGFTHRRKQLASNFAQALKISKAEVQEMLKKIGINPEARAQELTLEQWKEVTKLFFK
ncbi:MAG: 16S rRNA (adenine(1518)-N(6)/adenine(1519)-N(6))-dimethyltransferase RsmA [Patescibacteria group bacterium]|jgi:16S rRNA (adenine1518-N6/adenine1519-N6)-dimethyltransferase